MGAHQACVAIQRMNGSFVKHVVLASYCFLSDMGAEELPSETIPETLSLLTYEPVNDSVSDANVIIRFTDGGADVPVKARGADSTPSEMVPFPVTALPFWPATRLKLSVSLFAIALPTHVPENLSVGPLSLPHAARKAANAINAIRFMY